MDQNPYAPPRAVVSEPQPRISSDAPLFAISLTKLIVMNVVTLGIFELVWLYQHWATIRRRDRSDIWPVPRAIFGVLFGWSLFKRIQREGEQAGVQDGPPLGPLAVLWIITTMCWRLPEPFDTISLLAPVVTLWVQAHVNRINATVAPEHDRNDRFSGVNIVFIVLFCAVLALALVGALVAPRH